MSGRLIADKVMEFIDHPWGHANLEINGSQWSSSVNGAADGIEFYLGLKAFNAIPIGWLGGAGTLKECEIAPTVAFKCDNTASVVQYRVQGRFLDVNNAHPWVALCVNQVQTAMTAFVPASLSGLASIQTNFNRVPFELRVAVQCNAVEICQARIKNSSYVRYKYVID